MPYQTGKLVWSTPQENITNYGRLWSRPASPKTKPAWRTPCGPIHRTQHAQIIQKNAFGGFTFSYKSCTKTWHSQKRSKMINVEKLVRVWANDILSHHSCKWPLLHRIKLSGTKVRRLAAEHIAGSEGWISSLLVLLASPLLLLLLLLLLLILRRHMVAWFARMWTRSASRACILCRPACHICCYLGIHEKDRNWASKKNMA